MFLAFSCATEDNLPQLLVTLSSFQRHNPDVPVMVFHERTTCVDHLQSVLTVECVPLGNPRLLLAAIDYLVQKRVDLVGRALYLSANTLVRSDLSDFAYVNMDRVSLATQSSWTFPKIANETTLYEEVDEATTTRRRAINARYFSTDLLLLNLDVLRDTEFPSLLLTFVGSKLRDEVELLNSLFADKPIIFMPPDVGTRVESVIHLLLESREIAFHTTTLRRARVVVFPETVRPWIRHPRFNRLVAQLPMAAYHEELQVVGDHLPAEMVDAVTHNTTKHRQFFGDLPDVMTDIKTLYDDGHHP